jgi:hypothetical protein
MAETSSRAGANDSILQRSYALDIARARLNNESESRSGLERLVVPRHGGARDRPRRVVLHRES